MNNGQCQVRQGCLVVESWVFNSQVGLENSTCHAIGVSWFFIMAIGLLKKAGSKTSSSVCSRWVEVRPKKARFENPNGQHRTVSETSLTSFTV
jgi:hypothetical protein